MARVKAVLRRAPCPHPGRKARLSHADVMLDLDKRELRVAGRPVALTPHEYAILEALMSASGRIFTRNELLDRIYPKGEAVVIERVVDVHIGKLRQKIEPDPSMPARILTVRGVGYRFADREGLEEDTSP
jgi:DNA-binding response OmpR family regulator